MGNKSINNFTQIEKIIYKELLKKKMTVLKISYKTYSLDVYLYNDYTTYKKQKRQVCLYYKKVVSLQKTIERFGIKKKKLFLFLRKNKLKKLRFLKPVGNLPLIYFFYKKYFLCKTY